LAHLKALKAHKELPVMTGLMVLTELTQQYLALREIQEFKESREIQGLMEQMGLTVPFPAPKEIQVIRVSQEMTGQMELSAQRGLKEILVQQELGLTSLAQIL